MNVLALTQARTASTRLPRKVLKEIGGKTLLRIHCERAMAAKLVDKMIVCTSTSEEDKAICEEAGRIGLDCYRGSEDNVLDRFYQAAKPHRPKYVVRITSDCPLIDPALLDTVIQYTMDNAPDYCSNFFEAAFPDGQDIEVFTFEALETAAQNATRTIELEHVTPYIRENSDYKGGTMFRGINYAPDRDYGHVRITVDEQNDFDMMTRLIGDLGLDKTWKEYTDYLEANPEISGINSQIMRNEGYYKQLEEENKSPDNE